MAPASEDELMRHEILRVSQPEGLDVDDLAAAIRSILDSSATSDDNPVITANSALHSFGDRASHVMGASAVAPT